MQRLLQWLHDCRTNHQQCRLTSSPLNVKVRMLELDSTSLRLVEDFDVSGHFAALSHCWGLARGIITTKSLLPRHKQCILLDQLPQTFKDAVRVCHLLQIKHLWIDCLCIVQDDTDDWAREAMKMQNVYKCAELVLAASAATDSAKGLFRDRTQPIELSGPSNAQFKTPVSIFARTAIDHSFYTVTVSEQNLREPLTTRAWCLQEWLLARRLVHFSSTELVWDCRKEARCECKTLDMQHQMSSSNFNARTRVLRDQLSHILTNPRSPSIDILKCIRLWTAIVEEYTARELTQRTDRLVAISGLAKELANVVALGPYFAGLWHTDIARQLLWSRKEPTRPKYRNDKAVASSWSWGSLSEPVEWMTLWEEFNTSIDECRIKDCAKISIPDSGTDQFQPISRPILHLSTQLLHGTIRAQAVIDFGQCLATVDVPNSSEQHEIFLTIDIDPGPLLFVDIDVMFVKIVTFETPSRSEDPKNFACGSLVLLPSANSSSLYTRIGIVLDNIPSCWYVSAPKIDFYVT